MDPLRQPIELDLIAPKSSAPLAALLNHLKQVDAFIDSINTKMSTGPKVDPKFTQSVAQINKQLLQSFSGRNIGAEPMLKALGLNDDQVNRIKGRLKGLRGELEGLSPKGLSFNTIENAAKGISRAFEVELAAVEKRFSNLGKLLTPTIAEVSGSGVGGRKAEVGGPIPLVIPASQVQASVSGPITLTIPGAQVTGGPARNPATGAFTGGGGGSGSGGSGGGSGGGGGVSGAPKGVPAKLPGEIGRVLTQTEKDAKIAVETLLAGGQTLTRTFNDVGDEIKKVTRDPQLRNVGKKLREDLTVFSKEANAAILEQRTGDKAKDLASVARIKDQLAENIRRSFASVQNQIPEPARTSLRRVYESTARGFEAQALAADRLSGVTRQAAAQAQVDENFKKAMAARKEAAIIDARRAKGDFDTAKLRIAAKEQSEFAAKLDLARAHDDRANVHERLSMERALTQQQRASHEQIARVERQRAETLRVTARPPVIPPAPPPPPPKGMLASLLGGDGRMVTKGLAGFTPIGFAKNLLTVTGWTVAVTALFKATELVTYSLSRMIEVGAQTARLSQVFRGVGGNAQQLTDDVLELAAANGRSTDEAMDSAIAWSRLGLSRVQVNEAVRVSLMAANVAELSAGDATRHLSALMAAYGLTVSELDGVLGMLNNTSNKYNVTNQDLLIGLSRTANVAKQAGIPLAELQGIIGASVGRTGQTGANIGNAIKSVIVQLSNPEVQDFLQTRFGLEVGGEEVGQIKTMSQTLKELYTTYMVLNDEERKNLTVRVGGRTQASRFVAILESYMQAQRLAVDSQLHLNSAEEENTKILATQKAALAGLRSEWDRLVVLQGNLVGATGQGRSPLQAIESITRGAKNALRGVNKSGLSFVDLAAPALGLGGRIAEQFNKLMDTPVDRARDRYLKLAQEVAQMGRAAQGHFGEADRLRTLQTVVNSPQARRPEVEELLKGEDERLVALYQQNRMLELQAEIQQRIAAAETKAADEKQQATRMQADYIGLLNRDLATAEAKRKQAEGRGDTGGMERAREQLRGLTALKREAEGLRTLMEEIEDISSGDALGRRQRTVNLMAEIDAMSRQVEAINQIAQPDSATAQLDRRTEVLREQIRLQEQLYDSLKSAGKTALADPVFKQLQELKGQLALAESPGVRRLADTFDRRSLFARRAQEEVEHAGTGTSAAQRLLNQEKFLRDELNRARQRAADLSLTEAQRENENVRALVFQNQLLLTREQILKRSRDLAFEEKQARLEGAREFQKSLLFAGPGELLRKLAASQMAQRPMSAGQWFSLSPELRQDVDLMNGGEAVRRIREERNRLRDRMPMTPEQEANERWNRNNFQTQPAATLPGQQSPATATASSVVDAAATNAELQAVALAAAGVTFSLDTVTGKLTVLGQAVDSLAQRMNGGSGNQPVLGLSAGHALGESGIPGWQQRFGSNMF